MPFALCVSVIVLMPFAYKKTTAKKELHLSAPEHKCVLTLWNIDVFEGGVGSRADFLSKTSVEFKNDGVLVMVVSHTVDSALSSVEKGALPDMISYGVGVDFVMKYAKSLDKISFSGGEHGGKIYAYPWCVGGYFLIRKNEDNQPIDRLFVSQNTYNLPFGALHFGKIEAENVYYEKPLDAYVNFLSGGKNDALLGTQRDLKRLEQRGVEFFATPINEFNDLVQYVSVLTSDKTRYEYCVNFISYLIGEKIQKKLSQIGMTSAFYSVDGNGALSNLSVKQVEYTVSPFTDPKLIDRLKGEIIDEKITNNSLLDFKTVLKRL